MNGIFRLTAWARISGLGLQTAACLFQPDVLICRTEREIPKDECDKIALFCNVERRAVIEEKDKDFSIYEVPLSLVDNGLDRLIRVLQHGIEVGCHGRLVPWTGQLHRHLEAA